MPEIAKNEAIFPSANEVPRPATILMRTKSFLFCNNGTVNGNEIRRIFEDVQKANATCKENERLASTRSRQPVILESRARTYWKYKLGRKSSLSGSILFVLRKGIPMPTFP
jgi:hypothetical protein